MKKAYRIFAIALVFCFLILACPVCAVSGVTYRLPDLELEVTIPSGYDVVTRDTSASSPIFDRFPISAEDFLQSIKVNHIYLNAIPCDSVDEEIVVTMLEVNNIDLSSYSDNALLAISERMVDEFAAYGFSTTKYEVYYHQQTKFIKLYFNDINATVHGVQYYTIYNGKGINFTLRSYNGRVSAKQEDVIQSVVDSVRFDIAPLIDEPEKDSPAFVYTDKNTGAKFTVPEGWKEKAMSNEREFIDAKFVSTKNADGAIIYASEDMWEQMLPYEKIGLSRKDVNNGYLSTADIAQACGVTADKVSRVSYNGVLYYQVSAEVSADVYGTSVNTTMTYLIFLQNGYVYMFQFHGAADHILFSDFEQLVESVQYPDVADLPETTKPTQSTQTSTLSKDNEDEGSLIGIVFFVGIIILVLVVLAVAFLRKEGTEKPVSQHEETMRIPDVQNKLTKAKETKRCTKCGQELPLESVFCHICGTRINEDGEKS